MFLKKSIEKIFDKIENDPKPKGLATIVEMDEPKDLFDNQEENETGERTSVN